LHGGGREERGTGKSLLGWLRNIVDKLVGGGGGGGSWSVYCNNFVAEYECCGEGVMVSNSKLGNGVVCGWC
jgi:hypothetical protein